MDEIEFESLNLNDDDEIQQEPFENMTIPEINFDPMDLDEPEQQQQPLPMPMENQFFDTEEELKALPKLNYNSYLKKTFSLTSEKYDPYVEIENKYKDMMEENKRLNQVIEEYKIEIGKLVKLRQKERASTAYYKRICEIIFSKLQSEVAKKCQECQ